MRKGKGDTAEASSQIQKEGNEMKVTTISKTRRRTEGCVHRNRNKRMKNEEIKIKRRNRNRNIYIHMK